MPSLQSNTAARTTVISHSRKRNKLSLEICPKGSFYIVNPSGKRKGIEIAKFTETDKMEVFEQLEVVTKVGKSKGRKSKIVKMAKCG